MFERKPNPMRLAVWAIAGAWMIAASFYISALPIPRVVPPHPGFWEMQWANRVLWIVFLVPAITGLTVWLVNDQRFRRGFVDDIWSESELAPVRRLVESPVWVWVGVGQLVVAFLIICLSKFEHGGAFVYLVTVPMNAVASIRGLLTPPKRVRGGLSDWRNFKRLQSDHWGEARREEELPS